MLKSLPLELCHDNGKHLFSVVLDGSNRRADLSKCMHTLSQLHTHLQSISYITKLTFDLWSLLNLTLSGNSTLTIPLTPNHIPSSSQIITNVTKLLFIIFYPSTLKCTSTFPVVPPITRFLFSKAPVLLQYMVLNRE